MFKYNPLLENNFQESPTTKAPAFHKTAMNFEVDDTGIAIKFIDQVTNSVLDVRLVNTIEAVENEAEVSSPVVKADEKKSQIDVQTQIQIAMLQQKMHRQRLALKKKQERTSILA